MTSAKDLLQQCTLEEKQQLTSGRSNWTFFGVERLGLNTLTCADGPHGVRAYKKEKNESFHGNHLQPATLFPVAAAMASTFHPQLIHQVGESIGQECNLYDVDLLLAPGINLKRSPLGGRNFEYYSEDPYLTTQIASAFVNGVQSTGVGATIKHYALNEQEFQRRWINTISDERTMHELYLKPFQDVIKNANPSAIMTSYNRVNGEYAGESEYLMSDVLRDKWGYEGFVISDWGGVQHKIPSVKYGMNLEMPGPSEFFTEFQEAMKEGIVTEKELDQSLLPLCDFYDKAQNNPNKGKDVNFKEHHRVAQQVAKESIVLLENDGILPLKEQTKIAVIGQFASVPRINGGGSATVRAYHTEQPLEELQKYFDVTYSDGYNEEHTTDKLLEDVRNACEKQDVIVYFTGTTSSLENEGDDRPHMQLPKGHQIVFELLASMEKPIIVILNTGSAINVTPLKGNVNALLEAWLLGGANGVAVADVLRGAVNPSGRLAETFPVSIKQTPHYGSFPSQEDQVYYHGDLINIGYRYYDTHEYPVQYPFGYGLSYTTFSYTNLTVSSNTMSEKDVVTVTVDVTNTGDMDGYEVVQLYVKNLAGTHVRPSKELRAFDKVFVEKQTTKTVVLELTKDAFSFYDVSIKDFRLESGPAKILVGSNVLDIHVEADIDMIAKQHYKHAVTLDQPMTIVKRYRPLVFAEFVAQFDTIPWYNIEEPARRVINRIGRRHGLSSAEITDWKERFIQGNN